jgi:hypothetical protein
MQSGVISRLGFAILPAVVGVLVLAYGLQGAIAATQPGNPEGSAASLRGALVPISIGVVLLLTALAVANRTRSGLLLGQVLAVAMALAGIAFFGIEIEYLAQGGMSAAFAGPFMAMAVLWSIVWAIYAWRITRARPRFAPDWQPGDRGLGIVLSVFVLVASGVWLALGNVEAQAAVDFEAAYAEAEAYVAGTTLEVAVVDFALDESTGGDPAPVVEGLVLELTLRTPQSYALIAAPRLCLVDRATSEFPAYKEDILCWGTPGTPLDLESDFADLRLLAGDTAVRVELDRGASPCAFRSGTWSAELRLAPDTLTVETDELSPWPQSFVIDDTFDVPADVTGAMPSPPIGEPREDCLGISP